MPVLGYRSDLVLDIEYAQKHCQYCKINGPQALPHNCKKNFEGHTAGMEVFLATNLFRRSIPRANVAYTVYCADGDIGVEKALRERVAPMYAAHNLVIIRIYI